MPTRRPQLLRLIAFLSFFAASFLSPAISSAQETSLSQIHERLQDSARLAKNQGIVFVGEISSQRTRNQPRCSSGLENRAAFRIADILWADPELPISKGYAIEKDYIDCREKPLSAPFTIGTKVIVYCEARPGHGYDWLPPIAFSQAALQQVQSWIGELRSREGDPVLLLIHQRILNPEVPVRHPYIVFLGQITHIDPMPQVWFVTPARRLDLKISRRLAGDYSDQTVQTGCRSVKCEGLSVGTRVLAYCELLEPQRTSCLISTAATDDNTGRVEQWLNAPKQD